MSGKNKKIITTLLLLIFAIAACGYYIYDNLPAFRSIFRKDNYSVSSNIDDVKNVIDITHQTEKNEETIAQEDGLIGQELEIGNISNLYDEKNITDVSLTFTINDYYFTDGMPDEIPEEIRIQCENYFSRHYSDEDGSMPEIKCLVVDMDAYNPSKETVLFWWNIFSLKVIDEAGTMTKGGVLEYISTPYSMGTDMFHCVIESGHTVSQKLYFPLPEKFLDGKQAGLLANSEGTVDWVQSGNASFFVLDKERKQ